MPDNPTTEASFPASLRPTLQALVARAAANAAKSEELAFASEDELATAALVKGGLERRFSSSADGGRYFYK